VLEAAGWGIKTIDDWRNLSNQKLKAELVNLSFDSRAEFEGHDEILGTKKDLELARQVLRDLAGNEKLARKILGKDWRISTKAMYKMSDAYLDGKKRELARVDAGYRVRVVNNGRPMINYKPAGGVYVGPAGEKLLLGRVELGLFVGPNFNPKDPRAFVKLAKAKSRFTVVGSMGKKAGQYSVESIGLNQEREKFNLENRENGNWNPLIELSADRVVGRDLRGEAKKSRVIFNAFEADVDHPGTGGGVVLTGIPWSAPHKAGDIQKYKKQIEKDPYIAMTLKVLPKLKAYMASKGVRMVPMRPKASLAAERLGLIPAPKGQGGQGQRRRLARR
jgi:hypothetical protein